MTALRGRFTRRGGGAIVHFGHPPIPDVIHFAARTGAPSASFTSRSPERRRCAI
jgi:hypothetical protein